MSWSALGDSAWMKEADGATRAERLACVLELANQLAAKRIMEVRDIVTSFETLAVHFDPEHGEKVLSWLNSEAQSPQKTSSTTPKLVKVPVAYEVEKTAAFALGLSPREIVRLHSMAVYTVAAVGFSPGFPYLTGLPEQLHLPRRATPRSVSAGSVAIAGNQAGIYPNESQGGWHVLGRTDLELFAATRRVPSLLKPGDQVKFVPAECSFSQETSGDEIPGLADFEVIEPGALSTVQDAGRFGFQKIGVSPGGAADPVAARVANLLVGNPPNSALLECSASGPVLEFLREVRVAFVGWADHHSGQPISLSAGEVLDLRGRMSGTFGYLAFAGGIEAPEVLGSRSTDLRAGFGGWRGRALRTGDRLSLGNPRSGPAPGTWRVGWPFAKTQSQPLELRFLRGVQSSWFTDEALEHFSRAEYQLSPFSDRMGVRLDGPPLFPENTTELVSQPVVTGSVQVSPDGRAVVLMAERQTIGGYPQIGHIISADLPKLARALPGTKLSFHEVSLADARKAWSQAQREIRLLQAGLAFVQQIL